MRYDETRLEIADIKSAVRQSGYESAEPEAASASDKHEGHTEPVPPPAIPAPSVSKTQAVAPAPVGTASGGDAKQEKAMPDEAPSMTPKPSPPAPDTALAPSPPAGDAPQDKDKV